MYFKDGNVQGMGGQVSGGLPYVGLVEGCHMWVLITKSVESTMATPLSAELVREDLVPVYVVF
jgi:hypothetical protein